MCPPSKVSLPLAVLHRGDRSALRVDHQVEARDALAVDDLVGQVDDLHPAAHRVADAEHGAIALAAPGRVLLAVGLARPAPFVVFMSPMIAEIDNLVKQESAYNWRS